MEITAIQLCSIYGQTMVHKCELYAPLFNKYLQQYNILSAKQIAAFVAQIGHESGRLRYTEELASGEAYEGRKSLGNIVKGDGKKYKGRGLIQITGRANYKLLSDALKTDFLSYPELLKQPQYATESACWYWQNRGLNKYANNDDFKGLTKAINGGLNGYSDRYALWLEAKKIFRD